MEPTSNGYVFPQDLGDTPMTRSVALRAFFIFFVLTLLAAVTGMASQTEAAEALFMIGASLAAVMLFFAMTVSSPALIPVRVRRRR
jgi:hypothetical protein